MQFNLPKFNQIVTKAKARAPQMAEQIEKAAEELLCNPFIADVDGGLLWASSSNGNIYFAKSNGKCNCKAAEFGKVCKHRLADRLVRLYNSNQGH